MPNLNENDISNLGDEDAIQYKALQYVSGEVKKALKERHDAAKNKLVSTENFYFCLGSGTECNKYSANSKEKIKKDIEDIFKKITVIINGPDGGNVTDNHNIILHEYDNASEQSIKERGAIILDIIFSNKIVTKEEKDLWKGYTSWKDYNSAEGDYDKLLDNEYKKIVLKLASPNGKYYEDIIIFPDEYSPKNKGFLYAWYMSGLSFSELFDVVRGVWPKSFREMLDSEYNAYFVDEIKEPFKGKSDIEQLKMFMRQVGYNDVQSYVTNLGNAIREEETNREEEQDTDQSNRFSGSGSTPIKTGETLGMPNALAIAVFTIVPILLLVCVGLIIVFFINRSKKAKRQAMEQAIDKAMELEREQADRKAHDEVFAQVQKKWLAKQELEKAKRENPELYKALIKQQEKAKQELEKAKRENPELYKALITQQGTDAYMHNLDIDSDIVPPAGQQGMPVQQAGQQGYPPPQYLINNPNLAKQVWSNYPQDLKNEYDRLLQQQTNR